MQEKLENYKHYSTSNRRTSDIFMGTTFQLHLNTYTLSFSEEKKCALCWGSQCPFFLASGPEIMAFGAPSPTANHSYCH